MKLILDSGAFTVSKNDKAKIDIDEYIEFIKEHEGTFDYAFPLDVIGNDEASYKNWMYMRRKGIDTIPVFHLGTNEKWLMRYLKQTDYIGLGAIAKLNTFQRIQGLTRVWRDYLINTNGTPKVKVHGLGLTAIGIILRYPWYSVDSAASAKNSGFGQVYMPKVIKGNISYFNWTTYKVSDQAHHVVGKKSFLTLPVSMQQRYRDYVKDQGFELGSITYQEIRPRRTKHLRRPEKPANFELIKLEKGDPDAITLANDCMYRYKWNLTMWSRLIERLPRYDRKFDPEKYPEEQVTNPENRTLVYMVASTKAYLNATLEGWDPEFNVLVSFAYMNKDRIQIIKNYKNEKK